MDIFESLTQELKGEIGRKIKEDTIDRADTFEDFQKWEQYFKDKGLYKEIADKEMSEQNVPALGEFIYTLAQYYPSLSYYFISKFLFGIFTLKYYASKQQQDMYVDHLVEGDLFATFASKELEAGFELKRMQTVAKKEEDYWIINGAKEDVACTENADLFLLLGKIEVPLEEKEQYGIFLLQKNMPGITSSYTNSIKSETVLRTAALSIKNLQVGEEHFLGSLQNRYEVFDQVLDLWNLLVSAQLLGIARGSFEQALDHALKANRFGQRFMDAPYIQQQFARFKTELEVAEQYFLFIIHQESSTSVQVTQLKYKTMEVSKEILNGVLNIFGYATLPPDNVLRRFKSASESVKCIGETSDYHLKKISKQWRKNESRKEEFYESIL